MQIGKRITTVTSPKRTIRKWNERPKAIPVEIPKKKVKKDEKVDA